VTASVSSRNRRHVTTGRFSDLRIRERPRPVAVTVLCADPMLADGANAYLRGRLEVDVGSGSTDVLLVFGGAVDEVLRERVDAVLAEVAARPGATPRLVFVVDEMTERHLWWAVGRGLAAVLPRSTTSWDDVVQAVVKAREGDADLPPSTVGWLLEQVRALESRLAAVGVNAAGLTARETEILRLFAAGLDTADVARELNYSERTIKSTVYAVKERLGLRNRVHVVAHALRIGAI
jgi:DNA-binding NarL/FixJ family response regulator